MRKLVEMSKISISRTLKVINHPLFFPRPNDDADSFNPRIYQIHDLIMHQRARDAIGSHDWEELFLAGV